MHEIIVKSVLNKKKKRDQWFLDDFTFNPYEGCSFNCQYCYVRGSKYGENMDNGLAIKINAPEVLARQLEFRVKKNQRGMIALASATDPYIPIENRYQLTRQALELIRKYEFPVLMITKSPMILRDADLLKAISENAVHADDLKGQLPGAIVMFSISTADENITRTLEPGAPAPAERFETIRRLKTHGLMVGVSAMPLLPFISDTNEEIEKIVSTAKMSGADFIVTGGMTLFGNGPADSKTLYYRFLERTRPALVAEYKKLYRIFPFPNRAYLDDLDARALEICRRHNLRKGILAA